MFVCSFGFGFLLVLLVFCFVFFVCFVSSFHLVPVLLLFVVVVVSGIVGSVSWRFSFVLFVFFCFAWPFRRSICVEHAPDYRVSLEIT